MDIRIGHGYDVHALADGLRLVLAGVEVEHTKGCIAHSDGDVAIHAICDALLGALALGDIGKLFPDTSEEFRGIDSKILLRRVVELIASHGYRVGNIDCTIAMQRPRLRGYIDARRTGRYDRHRRRSRIGQGHHYRTPRLRGSRRGRIGNGRRIVVRSLTSTDFYTARVGGRHRMVPAVASLYTVISHSMNPAAGLIVQTAIETNSRRSHGASSNRPAYRNIGRPNVSRFRNTLKLSGKFPELSIVHRDRDKIGVAGYSDIIILKTATYRASPQYTVSSQRSYSLTICPRAALSNSTT